MRNNYTGQAVHSANIAGLEKKLNAASRARPGNFPGRERVKDLFHNGVNVIEQWAYYNFGHDCAECEFQRKLLELECEHPDVKPFEILTYVRHYGFPE